MELSAVADAVLPDYDGRVVFVDALTDSASGASVAQAFQVQYIPTSVFIDDDGDPSQPFVGPMSEGDLRARLDALIAE